jgi:hypothetical protein
MCSCRWGEIVFILLPWTGLFYIPQMRWVLRSVVNDTENGRTREEHTRRSATVSTTNPTWTDPGANPFPLRGQRLTAWAMARPNTYTKLPLCKMYNYNSFASIIHLSFDNVSCEVDKAYLFFCWLSTRPVYVMDSECYLGKNLFFTFLVFDVLCSKCNISRLWLQKQRNESCSKQFGNSETVVSYAK